MLKNIFIKIFEKILNRKFGDPTMYKLLHYISDIVGLQAALDSKLNLDQTTPQSVINGAPIFEAIQFDTTPTTSNTAEGAMQWNDIEGTLNLGMHGGDISLQIGQEMFFIVKNQTGSTITNGTPVMFAGAVGASGRILIQKAIANGTLAAKYIMGIATHDIANGADGYVTAFGKVRGINTSGSPYGETWNDGDIIYVSPTTAGYLTNVAPQAPNLQITVAAVVKAHAVMGTLFIRPTFNGKLLDLDDVDGNPVTTTGQIITWDNTNKYWNPSLNILIDDANRKISSNIGDLHVACGTDKTVVLDETVWDDMQFQISSGKPGNSNVPTWETFTPNTSAYSFAVNDFIDLGTNEPSHAWKIGTDGMVHLHITTKAANTSGSNQYAKFEIPISFADVNEVWTETTLTAELTIPTGTAALTHFLLPMGTLSLTNNLIGTQIKPRIKRIAATGGTEYVGNIFITQIGIHLEYDTVGSRFVATK